MSCKECGFPIEKGDTVCPSCGAVIACARKHQQEEHTVVSGDANKKKTPREFDITYGVIACVVLFCLVFVGAAFVAGGQKRKSAHTTMPSSAETTAAKEADIKTETPDGVVKQYYTALFEADYETVSRCIAMDLEHSNFTDDLLQEHGAASMKELFERTAQEEFQGGERSVSIFGVSFNADDFIMSIIQFGISETEKDGIVLKGKTEQICAVKGAYTIKEAAESAETEFVECCAKIDGKWYVLGLYFDKSVLSDNFYFD